MQGMEEPKMENGTLAQNVATMEADFEEAMECLKTVSKAMAEITKVLAKVGELSALVGTTGAVAVPKRKRRTRAELEAERAAKGLGKPQEADK
jgi:hypothetical protein